MKELSNLVASISPRYGIAMRELLVSNDLDKMRIEAAFARKALDAVSTPEGIKQAAAARISPADINATKAALQQLEIAIRSLERNPGRA